MCSCYKYEDTQYTRITRLAGDFVPPKTDGAGVAPLANVGEGVPTIESRTSERKRHSNEKRHPNIISSTEKASVHDADCDIRPLAFSSVNEINQLVTFQATIAVATNIKINAVYRSHDVRETSCRFIGHRRGRRLAGHATGRARARAICTGGCGCHRVCHRRIRLTFI